MTGYTKLFSSIVTSTVWGEPDHVRLVWITLLALSNRDGIVEASIPGLAKMAGVALEDCEAALQRLEGPDKYSRTKDFEGRRIAPVDGGWQLINHRKYRDKLSKEERTEYNRVKQQESRQRKLTSADTVDGVDKSALSADTDTDNRQQRATKIKSVDQDHRANARKSHRVLVKLCHQAITESESEADGLERVKVLAAQAGIPYDSTEVNRAMDVALNQRPRS